MYFFLFQSLDVRASENQGFEGQIFMFFYVFNPPEAGMF